MTYADMPDQELIDLWHHYEFILSESVSMSDINAQIAIEQELVKRGYDLVDKKIVKKG